MSNNARECPVCGEKGVFYKSGDYEIRDPKTMIVVSQVPDLEWDECSKCGECFLDNKAMGIIQEAKYKSRGLLSPRELKIIRKALGLTQIEIAERLRIGEKTYLRWEKGLSVQTKAHDKLIRLIAKDIEEFRKENVRGADTIDLSQCLQEIHALQGGECLLAAYGHVFSGEEKKVFTEIIRKKKKEKRCQR